MVKDVLKGQKSHVSNVLENKISFVVKGLS